MAHYTITYSCGHSADKVLYGPEAQRQNYIAYAAKSCLCPACDKAEDQAVCEAVEAEMGLPVLSGSEKQVAWARDIRAEKVKAAAELIEKSRPAAEAQGKVEQYEQRAAAVMQALCEIAQAKWWIEQRRDNVELTLRNINRDIATKK